MSTWKPDFSQEILIPYGMLELDLSVVTNVKRMYTYFKCSFAGDFPLNSTHALQSPAHLLSFNLDLTDKEIISSTELRLWYRILSNESLSHSDKQRISIFHVFKQNSDNYYGEDPTHYCTRELVSLERDGYVNFNITSALKQWLDWTDEDRGMFYLEVNIEDLQTVNDDGEVVFQSPAIEIVYTDIEGRYSKTTQLVLRTYSNNDLRRKRQQQEMHNSCSSEASKSCCKRTLVLDIRRDLGWTWILRPRKLTANFCSGFCSIDGPTATYHTLLNLIYHSVQSNPTGSPAPCCVPDKFAPVPLLIFNRTNIELVTVDDISIQSCICR